jgi:hypothetical protein
MIRVARRAPTPLCFQSTLTFLFLRPQGSIEEEMNESLLDALSQFKTNYNRFSVHSELGRISPEGFEDLHENQIPLKETLPG